MALWNWLKKRNKKIKTDDLSYFKKEFAKLCDIEIKNIPSVGIKGKVSIVLPVYNGEDYLEHSIKSVLSQTYKNIELIIVDDGSADNSLAIAERYAKKHDIIKLIHLDKNMKLPFALNKGFGSATGEFLTWISHDNIIKDQYIEKMVSEMQSSTNTAMVFSNMQLINDSGKILRCNGWYEVPPASGNVILPKDISELNTRAENTIGAAFMYRASAADVIGEYSLKRFGIEDYDYWMRMNEIFSIKHSEFSEPLYLYRFHKKSLTARDAELGITENRPDLMEFDKLRRKYILKCLRDNKFNSGNNYEYLKLILQEIEEKNTDELRNILI